LQRTRLFLRLSPEVAKLFRVRRKYILFFERFGFLKRIHQERVCIFLWYQNNKHQQPKER